MASIKQVFKTYSTYCTHTVFKKTRHQRVAGFRTSALGNRCSFRLQFQLPCIIIYIDNQPPGQVSNPGLRNTTGRDVLLRFYGRKKSTNGKCLCIRQPSTFWRCISYVKEFLSEQLKIIQLSSFVLGLHS
jgi:hypothetical protein